MGRRDETVICTFKKDKGVIPTEIKKKQPSVFTAGCFSYIVYVVNGYIFSLSSLKERNITLR